MTATTVDPGVINIDDRPLKDKIAEALKEREVAHKAAVVTSVTFGAAAGAGVGYLNYVLAMAIYGAFNLPSWFMMLATWSGYFTIAYLGVFGAWLGWAFVSDAI